MSPRELVVLGTASQLPTRTRNHNGYLLRWDGEAVLFDPGEGTQRQMTLAGVSDAKQYLTEANAATVTLAMIETKTAMANLDAIAAVPGIDVLFVGPSDLSIGLTDGKELDPHSDTVEKALDKIVAACRNAGKVAGLYCANAERAVACAKRGVRFMAVGSDLGFLRAGTAAQLKVLKG